SLLTSKYDEVFQARGGSQTAQHEVLNLLIDHMNEYHSDLLRFCGGNIFVDKLALSFATETYRKNPLDLAGRIVQEDLCLMAPGSNGYTLEAASLCFPSRWRLLDKIGRPLIDIHSPVPDYKNKLSRPVDRFFDKLTVEKPVWRVNWSLTDDPDLYQPVRKTGVTSIKTINSNNAGDRVFLRCERQTLRRLPKTGWILFTIKTYVDKVSALKFQPKSFLDLATLVRDLSPSMQQYKNIAPYKKALLGYLDQTYQGLELV
ncbi:MAG: DUF3445 domain-containing protein, partial [Rhodospirillaceae bacterium]|nr:DUF3445 domain-containing protein [Rhodospirillaceae bacterium]